VEDIDGLYLECLALLLAKPTRFTMRRKYIGRVLRRRERN